MHGRNLRRVGQSSQHPSTWAQLDERGQIQKHASGRAPKRDVGKIGAITRRVQRVGNRVFTGRLTSGSTGSREHKHRILYPYLLHNHMLQWTGGGEGGISHPRSAESPKGTHHKTLHREDLALAEGRLVLVEREGKTTPSNVPPLRRPFLVDLTAPPTSREVLDLPCPATFSSASSSLAISWCSSIVFSTTHARHE